MGISEWPTAFSTLRLCASALNLKTAVDFNAESQRRREEIAR